MTTARDTVFGIRFGIQDKGLRNANRQVDMLKSNVSESSGVMGQLGRNAIAAGNDIVRGIGRGINTLHQFRYELLGAFTAIAAVTGGATKAASDFEYQIRTTGLVARATADQIDTLADNAKRLGIETVFTATEAAEGQEILARAGFQTREILETLPSVLDAAAIENLELGRSADIVTSILRGMQMEVDESRRIIDVMANASRRSKTTMDDLGEAIPQVAAQSANLGFEIEELAAVFGLLADQGTKASRAGRLMRGVLKSLTAPSNQGIKALNRLGVELWENEDQFKSITGIVEEFSEAMVGMSEKEKQMALGEIFTGRRLLIFQQLLNAGSEEIKNFTGILEESGGVAEYMAEEQLDTFTGAIHRLRGSINVAAISLQLRLLPVLSNVVDGITGTINVFNEMPEMTQTVLGSIGILITGLLGVATVAAFLKTPFAMISGFFTWLANTALFKTIGGAIGFTAGKALILIGVLTSLYFIFEDLYLTMEHGYDGVLVPIIDKFLDFIGVGYDFADVWEEVADHVETFGDALLSLGDGFWSISAGLGQALIGIFTFDKELLKEAGSNIKDGIQDMFVAAGIGMFDTIPFLISSTWSVFWFVVDSIGSALSFLATNLVNSILLVIETAWNGAMDWLQENLGWSFPKINIEEFPDFKTALGDWFGSIHDYFKDNWNAREWILDEFDFNWNSLIPDWIPDSWIPGKGGNGGNPNTGSNSGDDSSSTSSIMGGASPINRTTNNSQNQKTEQRNEFNINIENGNGNDEDLVLKIKRTLQDEFTKGRLAETGGI